LEKEITNFFNPPIDFKEKPFLRGVGKKFLNNQYFDIWQEYLIKEYKPSKKYKIGLFLPCAWGKPYSRSYIHYEIIKTLKKLSFYDEIHQIIVSNSGVIPREWENYYPFVAYDWDPTKEWKDIQIEYQKSLTKRLKRFIEQHYSFYDTFYCYLRPDSDSYQAIKNVENEMNIKIFNCCIFDKLTKREMQQITINGIFEDCDNILLKPKNLRMLYKTLHNHSIKK